MNCNYVSMLVILMNGKVVSCNELWDDVFPSRFIKEGPVSPLRKEAIKEALKLLSFMFRESEQL